MNKLSDLDKLAELAKKAQQVFNGCQWYGRFQLLDGVSNDEAAAFISALEPSIVLGLINMAHEKVKVSADDAASLVASRLTIYGCLNALERVYPFPEGPIDPRTDEKALHHREGFRAGWIEAKAAAEGKPLPPAPHQEGSEAGNG